MAPVTFIFIPASVTASGPDCAASPEGPGAAPSWPLSSHLALEAVDSAVPTARHHARRVVLEWRLTALADTTELLVSELVTNAIYASREARSAAVRLWLSADANCVVIHVWDASDRIPARRLADARAECGRGLLLVESLSRDWGSYRAARGKVVWAML